ncbi:hypothetical protein HU675_0000455 [Bradyrhizobium septentrionale]|uniref:hypothetical protein n=1 Tax=Bradyrhizobium septentrionale TaxID=1404411 RepID=UPI0015970505|nr:hypothetical protein [Bradyrhizobium septentrionale]UGY25461.1 hypothetical protein HU675_0000455 [Bradyrhizobium septentrionale]
MPGRTGAIEIPAAIPSSPADLPVPTMTNEQLLSRAKQKIDSCETPLREAAEDIARASEQGATQREVALAVGKSPAWVNRLLRWRASGYEGSAFGQKSVQGVNKTEALPPPAITGTALPAISWNQSGDTSTDSSRLGITDGGVTNVSTDPARANTLAEAVQSTIGVRGPVYVGRDQRRDLIEALDLLRSTRPRVRAKLALIVEIRRAELGLTWDQLIIREDAFQVSNASDQEPIS